MKGMHPRGTRFDSPIFRIRSVGVACICFTVFLCVLPDAAVINVPNDYPTIQGAIDAATDGDEIIVRPWIYREHIDFKGKNVVLRSTDPTSPSVVAATIIDGDGDGTVVTFSGAESPRCVLSGFTITNGRQGIAGHGTGATIENNTVSQNGRGDVNGAGLSECNGLVRKNRITHNGMRDGCGGGLYKCNGTIELNTIMHNGVGDWAFGGGEGGGLYDCDGTICRNEITSNSALGGNGGGLAFCDGIIRENRITDNGVSVSQHYGSGGSGAALYSCKAMIENNTICGNRMLLGLTGGPAVANCTGLLVNCIIWDNSYNPNPPPGASVGPGAHPFFCCIQGWTGGGDNISSNPLFVDPANGDFRLQAGSPCIDAGSTYHLVGSQFADLDGNCRLAGGSVDMGCYEYGSSLDTDGDLLADTDEAGRGSNPARADTDGDGLIDGVEAIRGTSAAVADSPYGIHVPQHFGTIQRSIFLAFPGETITVSPGTYYENLVSVGRNFVLQGPGPYKGSGPPVEKPVVDGRSCAAVLYFTGQEDGTCAVKGLKIRNGSGAQGGGVAGHGSLATIQMNEITSNTGAGVYGCNGLLESNFVTSNTAAGIHYCGGLIDGNYVASNGGDGIVNCAGPVRNSQVYENGGDGIALVVQHVFNNAVVRNGRFGIANCGALLEMNLVSENTRVGIYVCGLAIRDCWIDGNHGGGLENCNGPIEQCWIWGNTGFGLKNCDGWIRNNSITAQNGLGLRECDGTVERNWIADGKDSGLAWCYGTIQNNVIYDNATTGAGGGLRQCYGVIRNNTIFGNSAALAGGGLYDCGTTIRNNIIWGNTAPTNPQIYGFALPTYCCIEGWALGGEGNIAVDPGFISSGDFRLPPDSPCVDAGGHVQGLTEDFEGNHRPWNGVAEPRGDGSDFDIGAYESVGGEYGLPNLHIAAADFGPEAPLQLRPGDPIALGAFVENLGRNPTGWFWLEFWASRTGGLTLDHFLADSQPVLSLPAAGGYSESGARALYGIPDGLYTVVFAVDRPGAVLESDECDNRGIVRGKRLLVIRPQTNVDLVVENFTFGPAPATGDQPLQLGGQVRNAGTQDSGPFWVEFWGANPGPYPEPLFFLCDSIAVANVGPGDAVDLSAHARTLYRQIPQGRFWVGCYADRPDAINELNETNNYQFLPDHPIGVSPAEEAGDEPSQHEPARKQQAEVDLTITHFDFAPWAPSQSKPGDVIALSITLENRGTADAGPFWLEFFGSTLGGLNVWQLLLDPSERLTGLAAGTSQTFHLNKSLLGVPDGPYTPVAVVDRLEEVEESREDNNRFAVAGKRILSIRPMTAANLVIDNFAVTPPLIADRPFAMAGIVRNAGTGPSGPFWIEFWGSSDACYPRLDFMLCDSIPIADLAPGQALDLATYARTLYPDLPPGPYAIGCFVDRPDQINETEESDNYLFLRGQWIQSQQKK